jgi:type IV pilus assembly protein PilB
MSNNHHKQSLNFEATLVGQNPADFDATIVGDVSSPSPLERSTHGIIKEGQSTSIITLVNKFLAKAVEKKAHQIQIEPEENFLSIRYGHEDTLKPLVDPLPKKFMAAIVSRIKDMAELDINQSQTPQKGRIRKRGGGRTIHFFVQTQPSFYGEKVMIRVVDSAVKPPKLSELIPDSLMRQSLETMMSSSSGLLVVTSLQKNVPSSLLYSLLSGETFDTEETATVEESINYLFPKMSQREVEVDGEEDYPDVLQSFLRKDKRRIMVDRLSNPSVARMVAEIVDDDRLLLTSLSAENGVSGIALLREMVTPTLLAETLMGVLHQHHLRRLCPACRIAQEPSAKELAKLGIPPNNPQEITFYQPRCLNETEIEQMREKGRLCRECNGEGYHGEVTLYELLTISPSLKTAIAQGAEIGELQKIAVQEQKTSLMSTGLDLVAQGQISLGDLVKLCPDEVDDFISQEKTTTLPTEVSQRLEKVESLLMTLTQEFNQLKQALKPTKITETGSPPQTRENTPSIEPTSKPNLISQERPAEIDLCKETIAANSNLYEELQDPGDWEALKRELDPNQETMIADFSADSHDETNSNSFKSIPDPWS